MKNLKRSIVSLLKFNERIHWERMKLLWKEIGTEIGARYIAYPILAILVSISHYAFASMHTMYETYMFYVMRKNGNLDLFKNNLNISFRRSVATLKAIRMNHKNLVMVNNTKNKSTVKSI